mmetsp:Transcript_104468/g.185830  ORF Transcript_104468/g.185830 Transcript_104468/m.185830 type:complete len:82 (+) Transcript_104468:908-1153(+)
MSGACATGKGFAKTVAATACVAQAGFGESMCLKACAMKGGEASLTLPRVLRMPKPGEGSGTQGLLSISGVVELILVEDNLS